MNLFRNNATNKRTHIEQEEKLKERGVRQTLWAIIRNIYAK